MTQVASPTVPQSTTRSAARQEPYRPRYAVRILTAASLFAGH